MFPGTIERLLAQGHAYAEKLEYDQAAEAFREALKYEEPDEHTLHVFAYSLYEIRQFEEAREATEKLLATGPNRYIEVMELYLSICMELRDFAHVEQLIRSLLDENIVPNDAIEKFTSILNLSKKLANLSMEEPESEEPLEADLYELEEFMQLPIYLQMTRLQMLSSKNIRPLTNELVKIVENNDLHPIVRSVALYILVEQQVDVEITIEKFEHFMTVNTKDLALPDEMPIAKEVLESIPNELEKETSMLEMVQYLVTRHLLVTYPFQWFDYSSSEVLTGYNDYVHSLFDETKVVDKAVLELIQTLEKYSDIPEV